MSNKSIFVVALLAAMLESTTTLALPIMPDHEVLPSVSAYDETMTNAYKAIASKKANEARSLFEKATKLDPKAVTPWLGLADAARLTNDIEAVEAALGKALELDPDSLEVTIAMARLHYARKDYDKAEKLLLEARTIDPKSVLPLVDLGDIYAGIRQNPQKAMNYYREAIAVAPWHAGAQYALGLLMAKHGEILSAIPVLQTAQELAGTNNPLPSLAIGHAYSKIRKWKDAQAAFSKALKTQPNLTDAYLGRATTFIEEGNRAKALEDLNKAEETSPNNPEAPFRIGMLHQEQGLIKAAYEAYERTIAKDPNYLLAYNNLVWLAATNNDRLDDASNWIKKARSIAPKNAEICDTHGWLLRAKGDLDGAMAAFREGISLKPNADLHYHLGIVQMEKSLLDDARKNFRQALQIKHDFAEAKDAIARLKQLDTTTPPRIK